MKSTYTKYTVSALLLLIIYAYSMMSSIATLSSNYLTIIAPMLIVILSLTLMVLRKVRFTRFGRFWLLWVIWILIEIIIGKTGQEKGNIFRMLLAPMSFFLFYTVSRNGEYARKPIVWGFAILFLLSLYWSVRYSLIVINENDFLQTNYVFWPLCCAPFIFLINNKWVKIVLIWLMMLGVVISMKRSAVIIAILVIISSFILQRRSFKQSLSIIIVLVISYLLFNIYFSDYITMIQDRMGLMTEDQGSGRIPIFQVIWKDIMNFSLLDILFGRGFGTISETGHTNAHNDFLQVIYEYGLIGLVYYISLITRVLKQLKITNNAFKNDSSIIIAEGVGFIILIVMGLVSNLVVSYTFFVFLCCFWGYVEGQYLYQLKIKDLQCDKSEANYLSSN